MSIHSGNYLFANYGFYKEPKTPYFYLTDETGSTHYLDPKGETVTLTFDTTKRFCTGWHDLKTGESHPCENNNEVDEKYHECRTCRDKTGFNPAFYHSKDISSQQEDRNRQPHMLYLAHFGPGVIKVGISWQGRGIARLLEQGARSALILGTFPTANVARQHEAAIAKIEGIGETVQIRKKLSLLTNLYDRKNAEKELLKVQQKINHETGLKVDNTELLFLDDIYDTSFALNPKNLIDISEQSTISGRFVGLFGGILVCKQDDMQFMYSLTPHRGHRVTIGFSEEKITHAPQQIGLF